jgi:hypothetical protein
MTILFAMLYTALVIYSSADIPGSMALSTYKFAVFKLSEK